MVYRFWYWLTDNTDRFTGFQPLPTDHFIGFSTDLSVIPIGKPIILILDFSNSKFKFKAVFLSIFTITSHTGGKKSDF
jgi:hypothetical protein